MGKKLRIHYFQHVPFEGIGYIREWAEQKGHQITHTRFYAGDPIPRIDDIDWLLIMGGPMNIYEDSIYPWLPKEKDFIKNAIEGNKTVIGFCLGGQLIAHTLGAEIKNNHDKEIGWFPIRFSEAFSAKNLFIDSKTSSTTVLHWHGDTFGIPEGAERIASSEACKNQAFAYKERVIALQFHLETTPSSFENLMSHCKEDYANPGKYIQSEKELKEGLKNTGENNLLLKNILDKMQNLPI